MTEAQLTEAEPIIKSVANRFEGGGRRCGLAVEDLQQEARVALLSAETKFKGKSDWRTFAWAVCFRRCHELTRRDLREDEFNGREIELPAADPGLEPETVAALRRAVASLPTRQRAILSLYYGLKKPPPISQEQIADRIGIPRGTVRDALQSSLKKIRQKLPRNLLTQ